jgi:hypothetical protein
MSVSHLTPVNGGWFPPPPTLDPPVSHHYVGHAGISVTINYAFKKRRRVSPVFKRTRSNPINNIHLGFPHNNLSKPAYVNTPFGGIERENGAFGTQVATVPLFSQSRFHVVLSPQTSINVRLWSQTRINVALFPLTSINVALFPQTLLQCALIPTKTYRGAIVRLSPHHHNGGGWR